MTAGLLRFADHCLLFFSSVAVGRVGFKKVAEDVDPPAPPAGYRLLCHFVSWVVVNKVQG